MNILTDVLKQYNSELLRPDLFQTFQQYFAKRVGLDFLLKRHNDPGMKAMAIIRVLEARELYVVVEVLDTARNPAYRTSITYSALIDQDNSQRETTYEIQKLFNQASVVKDE